MANGEIALMLDLIKDSIAGLAQDVYRAQEDGKITWVEALVLTGSATAKVLPIISAFQELSKESVKDLIDVLEYSDLVIKERP